MTSDQKARRPSRGRRRPDLKVTVIRRDVDDPQAYAELVRLLADLLFPSH